MEVKLSPNMSAAEMSAYTRVPAARNLSACALSWAMVIGAFALTLRGSWWFYPLSLLIIGNRQLALLLIGHEGIHGILFRSKFWNERFSRYLCLFPIFVSFSRYRRMHLLHHGMLGTPADPDKTLYADYPVKQGSLSRFVLRHYLSGRILSDFSNYYSDVPGLFRGCGLRKPAASWVDDGDTLKFLIFHAGVLAAVGWGGWWLPYLSLWVLPVVLFLPYHFLIGGLQHGPAPEGPVEMRSRTVRGPKWLMEILLPVDINFHAEHHLYPFVPHVHLRALSRELEARGVNLWRETYGEALRRLS